MRKGNPFHAEGTGEVVTAADIPHRTVQARLYHWVEATGCEAERSFFPLLSLIAHLRTSIRAFMVEQVMILQLNEESIPDAK